MNPKLAVNPPRLGLSLLELMIATATMATLMAAVVLLVHTGYMAWDSYEQDLAITDNGYAALRHLGRNLRQATVVSSITAASDTSGKLDVLMPGGATYSWDHDSALDRVYFNTGSGNQLLAVQIDELAFVGYEADGVTTTVAVDEIHSLECRLKITLPHGAGESVTLSCRTWLRSW
jgi:hypothetical protein